VGCRVKNAITGLNHLGHEIDALNTALRLLDAEFVTLHFNPADPASIERAACEMETAVAAKLAPYNHNRLVQAVAPQLKASYRPAVACG